MPLNLSKDKKWVFKKVVSNIEFLDADNGGELLGNAGFISKADLEIVVTERTEELSDSQMFQLGYDLSVKITSLQWYSAFEFDKLKNKRCYIKIAEIPLFVMPLLLNIAVQLRPGETKGIVTISGKKYGEKLTDLIAPTWNGAIVEPYALPYGGGIPSGSKIIPESEAFQYNTTYYLDYNDPLQEFINPSIATESANITEFKLTIVIPNTQTPISEPPISSKLKKFDGFNWVEVNASDYDIIYEKGLYKIHYNSSTALKLKDSLLFQFNIDTEESS